MSKYIFKKLFWICKFYLTIRKRFLSYFLLLQKFKNYTHEKIISNIIMHFICHCCFFSMSSKFYFPPQNGPTTVFTDLSSINQGWSTNYSVSWDWDLGDGNPQHNKIQYTRMQITVYIGFV